MVNVIVEGLSEPFDKRFSTNAAGVIKLVLPASKSAQYIVVEVTVCSVTALNVQILSPRIHFPYSFRL